MKAILLLVLSGISLAVSESRSKRAAYELPDGSELVIGPYRTSFVCNSDGYYADVENNCQIFHVCHTARHADGSAQVQQWSFFCGNLTVFNQLTFTCTFPEDAVPCANAPDFFYLNANLGAGPNVPFLSDQDVARAAPLISGLRSRQVNYPPPPVNQGLRLRPSGNGYRNGK